MQAITDTCRRDFTAVHNSGSRSNSQVKWIVLHDEEAATARSAAQWFANPASEGSAHLCVDDEVCFRTLPDDAIPWAASSAIGANTGGFHIEQAGFAKWSAVVWLSHLRTLQRAAFKTALHCRKFGIPTVFVDADGLLAGKRGVTTHAEVTRASKKKNPGGSYDHTDPGPLWPRRVFMAYVRKYAKQLGSV